MKFPALFLYSALSVSILALAAPLAMAQPKPGSSAAAKPASAASSAVETFPAVPKLRGFTLEGKPFSLDSEKGKVVLVLFWSTKSSISRDNMPELRANYEGWRAKGFQLVTVSVDDRADDAMNYDKLIQLTIPVKQQFPSLWRGDKAYSDNLGTVGVVPTAYLIGRDGKLVKRFTGRMKGDDWDAIAELVL